MSQKSLSPNIIPFILSLVNQSRDVFWIRSPDYSKQLYINPAYETVWGRTRESLYEDPSQWVETVYPEDLQRLLNSVKQRNPNDIKEGVFFAEIYRIIRPNGEIRWIKDNSTPIYDRKGIHIGFAGIAQDITDDKKQEEFNIKAKEAAEAASAAKTEFIRNMGHDLRTPLSGIIGMANMINHMPEAVVTQEDAKDIREAGMALLNLLNEIIETAQLESGDIKPEKSCFALKHTIDALTSIFRPAIREKGLTLETYYDDNIPEVLYGQELLLHRIILNLLGNAVKFTAHGAISLEVSLSQKTSDKVSLKIVVKDTGTGIPTDKQEVIFDKFSRLTPSYANNYKGSGLGLYMVKQFIEKLGGDIKVSSTLGNGAQFTCSVQFKIPTNAQLKKYHKPNQDDESQPDQAMQYEFDKVTKKNKTEKQNQEILTPEIGEKLHALLIEDTLLPRKIAEGLLKKAKYEVEIAETAQEAIEKSKQLKFDLIYMDIGLPDGTGIDVTKKIRENPDNPNVNTYIVALTAHADPEIKRECLAAGMQDVFNKPLDPKKIAIAETLMNEHLFSKTKKSVTVATVQAKKTLQEISKLPLLDLKVSMEMMGGNQALAKEMLDLFMEQLPEFQSNITEALNKKDWSMLKHYVHKLHGGICYAGATRLKAITYDFEVSLNKNTGNYADFYEQLIHTISDTEDEYKKITSYTRCT